jgi:hypothetical protein
MAKRKTFDDRFNNFINELFSNGTIARWEVEKKVKETKRLVLKTDRRLREERIINECLAAL